MTTFAIVCGALLLAAALDIETRSTLAERWAALTQSDAPTGCRPLPSALSKSPPQGTRGAPPKAAGGGQSSAALWRNVAAAERAAAPLGGRLVAEYEVFIRTGKLPPSHLARALDLASREGAAEDPPPSPGPYPLLSDGENAAVQAAYWNARRRRAGVLPGE